MDSQSIEIYLDYCIRFNVNTKEERGLFDLYNQINSGDTSVQPLLVKMDYLGISDERGLIDRS